MNIRAVSAAIMLTFVVIVLLLFLKVGLWAVLIYPLIGLTIWLIGSAFGEDMKPKILVTWFPRLITNLIHGGR